MFCSDVNATAALCGREKEEGERSGRSDLGGKQTRGPERKGMTAAPKESPMLKSLHGIDANRRPVHNVGKAVVLWEETDKCTTRGAGVGVQASGERVAEVNVGKGPFPAGTCNNLQRLSAEPKGEGGGRIWVRHMSPYERRRRGNALRGSAVGRRCPGAGNTVLQAKGLWALGGSKRVGHVGPAVTLGRAREANWCGKGCVMGEGRGNGAGKRFSLVHIRKALEGNARVQNRTREIRPYGIETGAFGNVAMGAGLRPTAKAVEPGSESCAAVAWQQTLRLPPDPKVRAPNFYPNRQDKLGASYRVQDPIRQGLTSHLYRVLRVLGDEKGGLEESNEPPEAYTGNHVGRRGTALPLSTGTAPEVKLVTQQIRMATL